MLINKQSAIANRILRILPATFCILLLGSLVACDVHQFPEQADEPIPGNSAVKVKVPFHLDYKHQFYVWNHNYDPILGRIEEVNPSLDLFPGYPGTSSCYDNIASSGIIDVHVKVYSQGKSSSPVAEKTFSIELDGKGYDTDFELELESNSSFRVAVWSHLRTVADAGAYYDPSNFSSISIIGSNYVGNTDYRDAFSGTTGVITTDTDDRDVHVIDMTRPMGKFELLTIDLSEFLDRETIRRSLSSRASADEYNVVISFPYYYPSSYSLLDDRLENSVSGVSFRTNIVVTGISEASLGFEYVLLNSGDGAVQMQVDIYDPSYTHVAGSSVLTVPLRRDTHTVLKGEFLSSEGQGGVGIDPGFNGDHNITI